jgi:ribosomal protein S18 acetylase RimI-like enzyme
MDKKGEVMLKLMSMTVEEYGKWLEQALSDYAQDHMRTGNWKPEEALEKASEQFEKILPMGIETPNHFLCSVINESSNEYVGMLWYGTRSSAGKEEVFIYNIEIDESHRRKGYGTQVMQLLEDEVNQIGLNRISLHVFGHNHPAIGLYEKLGYHPTNIMMVKDLE